MRILQKKEQYETGQNFIEKAKIYYFINNLQKYRDDQLNFLENYTRRYLVSDEFL